MANLTALKHVYRPSADWKSDLCECGRTKLDPLHEHASPTSNLVSRFSKLLAATPCPNRNCDNNGTIATFGEDGNLYPEQCQWCDERGALIRAADSSPETNGDLLLARNALGNLYMAVLKFGPVDRDIQFAMNEAGQLLGSPLQVKASSEKSNEQPSTPAAVAPAPYESASSPDSAAAGVVCQKHGVTLAFEGDECWACQEESA